MSDDGWGLENQLKVEEKQIPKKEQPVSRGRNRRGQQKEAEETTPKAQPLNREKALENEEENWIVDENKESGIEQKQTSRQNGRNNRRESKVQQEISEIIHPEASQLTTQQAPKDIEDSWDNEGKQKKGEQLKKDEQIEENENRRRGNRGRHQEQNRTSQGNQERRRGHRDYNQNQNQQGRNYGRNNHDRNDEGGNRYGRDRQDRGDRGVNWENREDRGRRGNFGGRGNYRGGYQGNRERNDREGGYQGNRDRNDRNDRQGGYQGNRDRNGAQGGNYRNDQEHLEDRNGRGNRNYNNNKNYNNKPQVDQKPLIKVQKVQIISCANYRRAWPSCQIFIYGRKLALTLRKVQLFNSKMLLVPYRNLKFDYYGGNFVLSSSASYKEKIIQKGEQLQKGGSVYFQKAIGLGQYQAVVFLKIDQANKQENLQKGIDFILKKTSFLRSEITLDSLVFPLSKDLCEPFKILQIFSKSLQTYNTIKQIFITTNEPQVYEKCMSDFNRYLMNTIENNELCLD